ncbi:MAG: hypothetical protein ACOX7F_01330 [Eubacteriales bacterium]|jgi:hypothetical protein
MRYKETCKSLVLAGLIVSSLLLAARCWVYGTLAPRQQFSMAGLGTLLQSGLQGEYASLRYTDARGELIDSLFLPAMVEVRFQDETFSIDRSASQLYEAHTVVRQDLLAGLPQGHLRVEDSSAQEWEQALQEEGVWLDFQADIPFQTYGVLLGLKDETMEKSDQFSFRWMVVSTGAHAGLYLKESSGEVHRVEVQMMTGVNVALERLTRLQQGSGQYVRLDRLEEESLQQAAQQLGLGEEQRLPQGVVRTRVLHRENPMAGSQGEEYQAALLDAFSMNPSNPSRLENSDGSVVYIENFSTLKFWQDGRAEYRVTGEAHHGVSILSAQNSQDGRLSTAELVAGVYGVLEGLDHNLLGGDMLGLTLGFAGLWYDSQQQAYQVAFRYQCDGMEIYQQSMADVGGYAIVAQVQEGYITGLQLQTCTYTDMGLTMPNLRMETVLAGFAAAGQPATEIRLMYLDTGEETVATSYLLQQAVS